MAVSLQRNGIDRSLAACSRDDVGKRKQDREPPSPQVKAAAEKICALGKARGLTIRDIAKKAHRPFQTFNNWKKGHTTAQIENMQVYASVVDATVVLSVQTPEEMRAGGFHDMKIGTFLIARMVDELSDADREYWRRAIAEWVEMKRSRTPPMPAPVLPLQPPAVDAAPRGRRKTGTRK